MGWLVTGASGMLGTDLCRVLDRHGISVTAVDRGDLDLLDPVAVGEAVAAHDVVVNCAAWTAVDDAETHEERGVRDQRRRSRRAGPGGCRARTA